MKHCLVAFDTDHIKQYIFATDTLKEIRGASGLLDHLNQTVTEKVIRNCVLPADDVQRVYANGGSAMFVVPAEHADRVIAAVQREYRQTTGTASITGVAEPLPDNWQDFKTPIPQHLRRASYKLQQAKAAAPPHTVLMAHGLLKECQSCEEEYAVVQTTDSGQEPILLCQSCVNKRQYFTDVKKKPQYANRPPDINALAELSKPRNYIGLIYADGNNMGAFLDALNSLAEVQQFSKGIERALDLSVQEACTEHGQRPPGGRIDPYEILLQGGDDLVMLTTAQTAIDMAITIATTFHQQSTPVREMLTSKIEAGLVSQMFKHEPTLSVSVILAHANFPLNVLLSLAESSLKFAKTGYAKRLAETPEIDCQGMLNFMTVYTANALDFETLYNRDLKDSATQTGDTVVRTLRPYTVTELQDLRDYVRQRLRRVPKRKLHQLRDAIFQEKNQAMLSSLAAMIRATEREKDDILTILRHFAGEREIVYPWYKDPQNARYAHYYTPLLDAIELYDFV